MEEYLRLLLKPWQKIRGWRIIPEVILKASPNGLLGLLGPAEAQQ
jgi:hypothetical protein